MKQLSKIKPELRDKNKNWVLINTNVIYWLEKKTFSKLVKEEQTKKVLHKNLQIPVSVLYQDVLQPEDNGV